MLETGKPLDNLHFHYFTSDTLKEFMDTIGEVVSFLKVEKSNSVFYAVRLD